MSGADDPGNVAIRPSAPWIVALGFGGVVLSGLLATGLVLNWGQFTLLGHIWVSIGIVAVGLPTVDFLQRRYIFGRREIRVRYLGIWKQYRLESGVHIKVDRLRRTLVVDNDSGRTILRIPREFWRGGNLPATLERLYA